MLEVLEDPQTCYYNPKQLENFMIENDRPVFRGGHPPGRDWRQNMGAGTLPQFLLKEPVLMGDRIVSVDGTTISEDLQRAADLVERCPRDQGKNGVERPGVKEPLEMTIRRKM